MSMEYKVELHTECRHRGPSLISLLVPWRERRPCRDCRRRMRNPAVAIVVPPAPSSQPVSQTIIYKHSPTPPPSYQAGTTINVR